VQIKGAQLLLCLMWSQRPDLPLQDVEFRNASQSGEDGILLYIFSLAGHGSRRAVALCAGDGIQNNTANLVINHGWDALMVDGDPDLTASGIDFYAKHPETRRSTPTLVNEWVTAANVNQLLAKYGYDRDIDLLSLDVDGVDYWILKAFKLRPRVIVLEYQNRILADRKISVPYSVEFAAAGDLADGEGFFGASLAAFEELLRGRGYRLIGANRYNTNAFFLREDVLPSRAACSIESCLASTYAVRQRTKWWPRLEGREWVEV